MGTINHHAIIITTFNIRYLIKAANKMLAIFGVQYPILHNEFGYYTIFIPPDGSKEGWADSITGDDRRKQCIDWLNSQWWYYSWVEVSYGNDNGRPSKIVNSSDDTGGS
jgi:uncharacterized protein YbdZ (MbtH family)